MKGLQIIQTQAVKNKVKQMMSKFRMKFPLRAAAQCQQEGAHKGPENPVNIPLPREGQ